MSELKPCGTIAAHQRHIRAGEEPCEDCKRAKRDYQRARNRKNWKDIPPPLPCGTEAAYHRHRRRGEVPCAEDRAAVSKAEAERTARRRAAKQAAA